MTDALAPEADVKVEADGSASVHVPFWVPPGRNGLQPDLSVDYNSRAGIGVSSATLGTGWHLSGVPLIHRCARTAADSSTGTSSQIAFASTDQICVDGEPLVPETPSMQLAVNSVYRTLHDSHRRFVITAVDQTLGPTTIVAYGKDGRVTTWGTGPLSSSLGSGGFVTGSQYYFQTNLGKPGWKNVIVSKTVVPVRYGWLLNSVADHNGNEIDYKWWNFQCDSTSDFIPGLGNVFAPESISYTANTLSGLKATKFVQFNYDSLSCSDPVGQNSAFIAGVRFEPRMLLTNIQMLGPNNGATIVLRQYNFNYGNDVATPQLPVYSARHELSDVLECDDANVCRPGIHFSYGEIGPLDGEWADTTIAGAAVGVVNQDPSLSNFPPRIYVADLNYDGRDDLLYGQAVAGSSPLGYVAQFSTGDWLTPTLGPVLQTGPSYSVAGRLFPTDFAGNGFARFVLDAVDFGAASLEGLNNSNQFQTLSTSLLTGTTTGEMADLDGDGLPDLVETNTPIASVQPPMAWDYRKNGGHGVFVAQQNGNHLPVGPNDHRLIDIDGDGSAEILTVLPPDSSRYSAVHAGTTPIAGPSAPTTLDFLDPGNPRPYVFADLNGDGLTDAVQFGVSAGDTTVYIRFNSGNGFFPPVFYIPASNNTFGGGWTVRTIDFNNDGKQDLLLRSDYPLYDPNGKPTNQPLHVLWFDGRQMNETLLPIVSATNPASIDPHSESELLEVGDFNGDGLDDIAMVNDFATNQATGTLHLYIRQGSAQKNRQLISVDRTGLVRNGVKIPGEEIDIAYAPITDTDVATNTADNCANDLYPWSCVRGKLQVVSDVQRWDDTRASGSPLNETTYSYKDARRDMRGRGFLGFQQVRSYQRDTTIATTNYYDLSAKENTLSFYPFAGVPYRTDVSTIYPTGAGTTQHLRSQISTLTTVHTFNGSYFVYPSATTDSVTETFTNGTSSSSTILYTHSITQSYDPNGNLLYNTIAREDQSVDTVGHSYTYSSVGLQWPQITSDLQTETSTTVNDTLSRQKTMSYDANWNLASVLLLQSGNDRGEQSLTVKYTPTLEGLPQTIQFSESSARGGTTRSIGYQYDSAEHAFPALVTDTLNHAKAYAIHPGFGLLAVSQDENGLQATYNYDAFGRPTLVSLPTGKQTSYDYVSVSGDAYAPVEPDTLVRVNKRQNSGVREVTETNWRQDVTARRTWSRADGKAVFETFSHDAEDRLTAYFLPSFTLPTASSTALSRAYDSLDRVTSEQRADGSSWAYSYSGLRTDIKCLTDGTDRTVITDGRGRISQTLDYNTARVGLVLRNYTYPTTYSYGPFNTLFSITDAEGNVTKRQTNRMGSLWKISDPDAGPRTNTYNAFGDVETETTNEFTTSRFYDTVGRIKSEVTGTRTAVYTWDTSQYGIGKIGNIVSPDQVTTTFGYDSQGRVVSKQWAIGTEQFLIADSFDSLGRLTTMKYPALPGQTTPFAVTYKYDLTSGALQTIADANTSANYWTWMGADPSGQFTVDLYGNNVTSTRIESATNRTTLGEIQVTLNAGTKPTPLRDVSYTVDAQRNLTGRTDNLSGGAESFVYDRLNRLVNWDWSLGNAEQTVNYTYDTAGDGNLISRNILTGNGVTNSFGFDRTKAGPHQLLASGVGSYAYDGNGRQKSGPGRTTTFNEFDLPALIANTTSGDSFQYSYDGLKSRVLKTHSNGDKTNTLDDLFERRTPNKGTATYQYTVTGPSGPIAIAMATTTATPPTVYYLHSGYTGSIELITDKLGNVVDRPTYDPFGARIQAAPPELASLPPASSVDVGFAGMQHDDEASLGLINMHGRIYDPSQSRFLSVDPLISDMGSQGLNPYSYVRNNPLTFRDPTGFEECTDSCTMSDEVVLGKAPIGNSGPPLGQGGPAENGGVSGPGLATKGLAGPSQGANHDGRNAALPSTMRAYTEADAQVDSKREFETSIGLGPAHFFRAHRPTLWEKGVSAAARALYIPLAIVSLGRALPSGIAGADSAGSLPPMVTDTPVEAAMCFLPGTEVLMADGSKKRIEDIHEGEYVLAQEPGEDHGPAPRRVTQLHKTATYRVFHIAVGGDFGGEILATGGHPFWTERGWVNAEDLSHDDTLRNDAGRSVDIASIAIESRDTTTYNLSVEDAHTFFVFAGDTSVLVHNVDPYDILYLQSNYASEFTDPASPWNGRTIAEAVAEAQRLGRLPDGLTLNAMRLADGRWASLNTRTLAVARQANLSNVNPVDAGNAGLNQFKKMLRDSDLIEPIDEAVMRCK